jgi:putative tryptophan/tyrosine transport system substrate-binding protein
MKRRTLLGLLGGAAAWPLAAHAQQAPMPVVGFLTSLARNDRPNLTEAFRRGLSEAGFVEGRNVAIEYRFADNVHDRLPALAADLVARKVSVIAAVGGGNSVLAAKAATTTIPIVFTTGDDPIRATYVTSINRPGGNVTGVSFFSSALAGKRLELLREMLPGIGVVAVLVNPQSPEVVPSLKSVQDAARLLGLRLIIVETKTEREVDEAFATLRPERPDALTVFGDPFLTGRHRQIVAHAARVALPALYANREFVDAGGLASYGNDVTDGYRRNGVYVGRILNGASPAELPVDQATKFDFVVNAKTARALSLNIPLSTVARADEVIE